jgi:hypothetical protein
MLLEAYQGDTDKMVQTLALGTYHGDHAPWGQTFADNKFQTQM